LRSISVLMTALMGPLVRPHGDLAALSVPRSFSQALSIARRCGCRLSQRRIHSCSSCFLAATMGSACSVNPSLMATVEQPPA
jgi:hypothetical protein